MKKSNTKMTTTTPAEQLDMPYELVDADLDRIAGGITFDAHLFNTEESVDINDRNVLNPSVYADIHT